MELLITNGRLIDPASGTDAPGDLLIRDGVIVDTGGRIDPASADRVIDAAGDLVMPGLIDLHVHFRDPGLTHKETVESGVAAAAHGGYTCVFAMPNTKPVADAPEVIRYVEDKAAAAGAVVVHQVGAVTKGQAGEEPADWAGMRAAGMIAMSEDGKSCMNSGIYREAMRFAAANDVVVMAHCEDINMVQGGVMNLDEKARSMGMKGISNAVEDVIVARDILIARETGARLHLCHCSTKDSVRMVREARADGLPVSGEVCPHHFTLSTDDIPGDDPNYKMNPPLRTRADVETLRQGLSDGTMEVISTDHAPHTAQEKSGSMKDAPFGIVGLETAAALTWTVLVEGGYLTPLQMAEKMSLNPARIAGIRGGTLSPGERADVVILNVTDPYEIDPADFMSMGRNTPFGGMQVRGRVRMTIAGGQIVYEGEAQ